MEALTLCWIFDKRWFFGLPNPFMEFLLVLPIGLDIGTVVGIVIQRHSYRLEVGSYFITLVALYALLSLACLYILLRTYFVSQQQLEEVNENYQAIREFTHHFESKKSIWGLAGLLTTGLVVSQIIINHLYMNKYTSIYPCLYNRIRFWTDIACWCYIGLIIFIFLICKLVFLFISWKHPQFYLEYKDIV